MLSRQTTDDEVLYSFNGHYYEDDGGEYHTQSLHDTADVDECGYERCKAALTSYPAYIDESKFTEHQVGAVYTVDDHVSTITVLRRANPIHGDFMSRRFITPHTQIVVIQERPGASCDHALDLVLEGLMIHRKQGSIKLVLQDVDLSIESATSLLRIILSGCLWSCVLTECVLFCETRLLEIYSEIGSALCTRKIRTTVAPPAMKSVHESRRYELLRPSVLNSNRRVSFGQYMHALEKLEYEWMVGDFPSHKLDRRITKRAPHTTIFRFKYLPRQDLTPYIKFLHRDVLYPHIEFSTDKEDIMQPCRHPSEWVPVYIAERRQVAIWSRHSLKSLVSKGSVGYPLYVKYMVRASWAAGVPVEIVNKTLDLRLENPWRFVSAMNPLGKAIAKANQRRDEFCTPATTKLKKRMKERRCTVQSSTTYWTPTSPSDEICFLPFAAGCAYRAYASSNDVDTDEGREYRQIHFQIQRNLFDMKMKEHLLKREFVYMYCTEMLTKIPPHTNAKFVRTISAIISDFADFRVCDYSIPESIREYNFAKYGEDGCVYKQAMYDEDVIKSSLQRMSYPPTLQFESARNAGIAVGVIPGIINLREHNAYKKQQEEQAVKDADLYVDPLDAVNVSNASDEDQSAVAASIAFDHPNQEDYMNALAASPERPKRKRKRS